MDGAMIRKLASKMMVLALLTASLVTGSMVGTAFANGCSLFNNVTNRYEVDSQSDLITLGTDVNCQGREIHQTADIELDGWNTPVTSWYGTFNGGDFRIKDDVAPASQSPLFWNPPGSISINNVHRSGNVTHNNIGSGGFVGYSEFGVTIAESSMTGDVNGTGGYVGGFVGAVLARPTASVEITGSSMNGAVTGDSPIGGFVGGTEGPVTISTSSRIGPTSGSGAVGGFVGQVQQNNPPMGARGAVTITGSYSTGNVSSTGTNAVGSFGAGGFVASAQDVTIESSYTTSTVATMGVGSFNHIGGFVGYTDTFTVSQSYTSGDVSDTSGAIIRRVGGFVAAANVSASISDSFATGDVIGSAAPTGGLIGLLNGTGSTITRTYTTGDLIISVPVISPGFVGDSWIDPATVTNSFCRYGATNCGVLDPATEKTSAELKSTEFLTSQGWDFWHVWCVRGSLNDGYPVLRAINFGPGNTNCQPTPIIRRASLDSSGGTCIDGVIRNEPWTSIFVGYHYLPGPDDCTRPGYTFAGWAERSTPTTVIEDLPLLTDPASNTQRYFIYRDADLVAVWTATPIEPAPTVFFGVTDWLCRNCGILLFWNTPSSTSTPAITNSSGSPLCTKFVMTLGGWTMCYEPTATRGMYTLTTKATTLTTRVK